MEAGSTADPGRSVPVGSAGTRTLAQRVAGARVLSSPLRVAAVVTVLYSVLALGILAHRPAGDFAFVGKSFVSRSGTSAAIRRHASPTTRVGYDGQFALFIALDPAHAAPAIDKPSYRYSHILYPMLARALALGNDAWVAGALIVVNLVSIFFGTLALGLILRRNQQSPALAALFGLFAGTFVAFDRDVSDLLAYALVALGVLALRWDRRNRIALAGAAFAAAALARETTLIFPAVLAVAQLFAGGDRCKTRISRSAALASLAALPYVAWRVFVLAWLGADGSVPSGLAPFPFAGVAPHGLASASTLMNIVTVVAPAILLLFVVLGGGLWRRPSPYAVIIVVQILLLVIFLPAASYADYFASGRLQIGAVVAALCCAPSLTGVALRYRRALGIAMVLAMAPSVDFMLFMLGGRPV